MNNTVTLWDTHMVPVRGMLIIIQYSESIEPVHCPVGKGSMKQQCCIQCYVEKNVDGELP